MSVEKIYDRIDVAGREGKNFLNLKQTDLKPAKKNKVKDSLIIQTQKPKKGSK